MTRVPAPLRVVFTGSESTGKTDLAEWLAAELQAPMSVEYARGYAGARGGSAALTADDVEPIARGQLELEEAAIAAAVARDAPVVVHDTDLLSTLVYAAEYYGVGAVPHWLPETVLERKPDLYLLCDIDVPWHGDPVRDDSRVRRAVQGGFEEALGRVDAAVVRVGGSRAARRATVRRAVDAVAAERAAGSRDGIVGGITRPSDTTHPNRAAFPPGMSGPSLRALHQAGVRRVADLAEWAESDLRALHGMGPKAIGILQAALAAEGKRFRVG